MFLRKLQSKPTGPNPKHIRFREGFFLFFILLIAFFFSSLTNSEMLPFSLIDSLNNSQFVYFDFGSYELKPESHELLDKLSDALISNSELKVQVTGHTDDVGSEPFNQALSEKRALTVKEYLVSRGCNGENILTTGKGKSEPLNDNLTELNRAQNRRVEFTLINQKPILEEKDITYVNSSIEQVARNELKGELSVRDTSGETVEDLIEEDVSAMLNWQIESVGDSTNGTVKFLPIDEKKKVAFTFTMDYSPSMYNDNFSLSASKTEKILAMELAVHTFISKMENKNLARIIKFGKVIDLIRPYTRTKELLYNAITDRCYPRSGTALFKSIYTALRDTIYNSNPTIMRAVIAFSDGEENSSGKITKDSIYRLSDLRGIRVYTVGLIDEPKHSEPVGLKGIGEADLVEIASRTGGFYWWSKKSADLPYIYSSILNQILKSYQVSILWNENNLPPKGTKVTAVLRVNVKGRIRTVYKDYVME